MAGIKTLHYVDIKNVESMMPTTDGWSVTLATGHDWKQIQFADAKANTESDGEIYKHTVEATLPAKGDLSVRDLMVLERGRYLVRVTDNNGVRWLMGETTAPMRLTVADNNDGKASGDTSYRLVFSAKTHFPQMKVG